jgi:hypothetical protein
MKKYLPVAIIVIVVVAGGSFFGGMKYGESKTPSFGNFGNLTAAQRQQFAGDGGQGRMAGNRAGGMEAGGGITNGEIASKDATSITLKLRDGGSKIVLYSPSTQIMKSTTGAVDDVVVGQNVVITGSTNPDGSITAQNIQLRPAVPVSASVSSTRQTN